MKFKPHSDLVSYFSFWTLRWHCDLSIASIVRGIAVAFMKRPVSLCQLWDNNPPWLLGIQSWNLNWNHNSNIIFVIRDFVVQLCPLDSRNHRGIDMIIRAQPDWVIKPCGRSGRTLSTFAKWILSGRRILDTLLIFSYSPGTRIPFLTTYWAIWVFG